MLNSYILAAILNDSYTSEIAINHRTGLMLNLWRNMLNSYKSHEFLPQFLMILLHRKSELRFSF